MLSQFLRKLFIACLAVCALSATMIALPAQGQQQNEIILSVDFDGTASFSDPLDDGSGNGVHTPGEDGGPNNNVVRTNDQVQYRIDWNVNEANGSAVTVKMSLPDGMTWLADPTTTTGVPAGCASGSISGNGGRDLECVTDSEFEGSNGAIHPRALVGAFFDGDSLTPTASVETAEQPPVVSNTVPLTVSARPKGDWIKGEEIVDAGSGDTIGYKPNEEIFNIDNSGEIGRIFVWNLRLVPAGGLKGAEPMNDAVPINFFDHMWYTSGDAVLATGLMPNGRSACGGYDGDGAFPFGSAGLGTPAQTTAGTWTCTDQSAAAGYGYPVVEIDIGGHDTLNPPASNADGSGNSDTLISGQIAFWISESNLAALPNPRFIANGISGDDTELTSSGDVPAPIQVNGTNGPVDEANYGIDNNSSYEFPAGPPTTTPGRSFRHWVKYMNGPPQQFSSTDPNTGLEYEGFDYRHSTSYGGTGYGVTDGANNVNAGNWWRWDGDGQVPRGNEMMVVANFTTTTNPSIDPNLYKEAINGCVVLDTTHQEIIPYPTTIPVSVVEPHLPNPTLTFNKPTIGGFSTTPSPQGGGLAQVIAGPTSATANSFWAVYSAFVTNRTPVPYVVEYAAAATPVGNNVDLHGATCSEADADGRGWVDGATGDFSVFDPNGDGRYEDLTHVRVRVLEDLPWHGDSKRSSFSMGHGFQINLHVRVKDNPAAGFQEADQELFVYASRARGLWDGTGQPSTASCTNTAAFPGAENVPATGWCNRPFADDGANSTDISDFNNDYDSNAVEFADSRGRPRNAHADTVYIVEPALGVSKKNLGGASTIVVNGDIVEFEVNAKVVGSSLDSIADVRIQDNLNANYEFVGFTQLPVTPGAACSYTTTISCTFGTHPGGWSDTVRYEVKVKEAGANATIRNTATIYGNDPLTGTAKTPASSSAYSYTPAPYEESGIVKVLGNHIGPCPTHPTDDPPPADWATRCELVAQNSGLLFDLTSYNEGNVDLTNYRLIDVLPHAADGTEPTSATGVTGDGRSPQSAFTGTVEFSSIAGPAGSTYLYSADAPTTISRDPEISEATNTWCDAASGGTAVFGTGACPTGDASITAVHINLGTLPIGDVKTVTLGVQTVGNTCDDHYTNTFGARTDELRLPIRSNDVTLMVGFCDPSIDIEKLTDGVQADTPSGPAIAIGDTVTWTYTVTNDGETAISNATVTDDQGVTVSCDVDGDGTFDGTNVIPFIPHGGSVICQGTAPADTVGQYSNNATVEGVGSVPNPETCGCDISDPATWPADPSLYEVPVNAVTGEPDFPLDDEDPSHYYGYEAEPAVDIEKDTNGVQADTPSGPNLSLGDAVTWTYVIENTGTLPISPATVTDSEGVTITCAASLGDAGGDNIIDILLPSETVTCSGTGTATTGQYSNTATVSGPALTPPSGCACDPDDPTTWPTDPDDGYGQMVDDNGDPVTVDDEDDSHYFGADPSVDIEKDTNGDQADTPNGPIIAEGDPVTWTYVILNDGNTALAPATVTDSEGVSISCDLDGDGTFESNNVIPLLVAGASVTCEGTGVSTGGQYSNTATIVGPPVLPDPATCGCDLDDPSTWPTELVDYSPVLDEDGEPFQNVDDKDDSHYFGATPAIDIEKDTNGIQADTPIGPYLPTDGPVTWTYVVENTGNTALTNAEVSDDQGVVVSCDIDDDGSFDGTNTIPFLVPGDQVTCEGTGTAVAGQYTNNATVTGDPAMPDPATCGCDLDDPTSWPSGSTNPEAFSPLLDGEGNPVDPVDDEDPSHYWGVDPGLDVEKSTNGVDADTVTGPQVPVGDPVTWTYDVANTGNTALTNVVVTDDQGVTVNCDVDGDGVLDDSNVIPFLAHGASVVCEGTGISTSGQYTNNASVTGDPVVPDPATCGCDLDDPTTWPTEPGDYITPTDPDGNPIPSADDNDASHYFGTGPGIDIEKDTNGEQADTPVGPQIPVGDPVTWTYVVTNIGNTVMANATVTDSQGVIVDCDVDSDGAFDGTNIVPLIQPGAGITCQGTGLSTGGQYTNNASVSGDSVVPDPATCGCDTFDPSTWPADPGGYMPQVDGEGNPVGPLSDADDSHYFGVEPSVDIEKSTNGADADVAPGPAFDVGETITWTYVITNTGNVPLADAVVTDDQGVTVSCDVDGDGVFDGTNTIQFMAIGASVTCEGSGTAEVGAYENNGSISGTPLVPNPETCGCDPFDPSTWPTDPSGFTPIVAADGAPVGPVKDNDPSHYHGNGPGIDLEKATNGSDSDEAPGEEIASGAPVTWSYVVTNIGNTPIADATVTDDQGVTVHCDLNNDGDFGNDGDTNVIPLLLPGSVVTCQGEGTASAGPYTNNSSVAGDLVLPDPSTCGCDLDDPSTWPTDPSVYAPMLGLDGLPVSGVGDEDPSNYTGVLASIAGTLWHDANEDGLLGLDEDVFSGILVELLDADGNPVLDANGDPITTVTDADGNYFFDVEPGPYRMRFTPPEGFRGTLGSGGDNDADPASFTTGVFNVGPGDRVPDVDAGYLQMPDLAFTGGESRTLVSLALLIVGMGLGLVVVAGRRRRSKPSAV